jgi:predicted permease
VEDLIQDIRYGIRSLYSNPGFTLVAVLALALGTGANTAVFSVVNAVLLRPLPYREPDSLIMLWSSSPKTDRLREPVSVPDMLDYRSQSSTLEGIASLAYDDFNLSTGDVPLHVQGSMVTANFFSVLGVTPALGRFFAAGEDRAGPGRVVVISNGLWKRRFGADPGILDHTIQLNGGTFNIIGVAPATFRSPEKTDELWIPLTLDGSDRLRVPSTTTPENLASRKFRFMKCVARLRSDATIETARADLSTIAARLEQQYPDMNSGFTVNLISIQDQIIGDIKPALRLLLAVVALVLLIACANVANLLLARGSGRHREIAIRLALGARRARVIRQLLTESTLLGLVGGAAGLLLAYAGIRVLIAINPANIPRLDNLGIDFRVLGFTLVVSLAAGLLFGVAPAIQVTKPDLCEALKEGTRGSTEGGVRQKTRSALVVLEVALTNVLLICAALMLRSFYTLQSVEPGFAPANVLTMQVALPPAKYSEDSLMSSFFEQALKRMATLPGVESVGAATTLPLQPDTAFSRRFTIENRAPASPNERLTASYRAVSPDFFSALLIPVLKGRVFTDSDRDQTPPVIVINEAMKRLYWGDEDPVGRRMAITAEGGVKREIIGVVGNIKQSSLHAESGAEMYETYLQSPWSFMAVVIRTAGDPNGIADAVRREILAVDPEQPVFDIRTMQQIVDESINQPRLYTTLLAIFAAVATILAAVGIYGVMSYTVSQRRHEIGIRMALGANPPDILRMVVRRAINLSVTGIAIGLAAAWFLTRLVQDLLYGVAPRDPVAFLVIPLGLALVALGSSYWPARRATRVDPMVALRTE